MTLGAVRHPFSSGVAFGHGGGRVGCDGGFFLLSHFLEKMRMKFQKNNRVVHFVIFLILVILLLITVFQFSP
jgi:hypothetical protein